MAIFFVQTYGCTSNKFDSERMMGLLLQEGHKIVSNPEDADYLLVNTCGVKSQTEEKIVHKLAKFSNANKKIIVAGCLPKINFERIKKTVPNFAAIIDTNSVHKINSVVEKSEDGKENIIEFSERPTNKLLLPKFSFSNVIGIIKISEGCLSDCSFCATKFARGELFSYRPDDIRENIKQGLKEGCKEFHLTSEDCSAYGRDIDTKLPTILESVAKIEGNFFVRLGMMNPLHFKKLEIKNLIEAYKSEKIFKFLHLCVQSGSNRVLKDMNRGYKVEDFVDYVNNFRKEIPHLTLETDIITGFPTETKEDFQKTVELLKEVKPDIVNLSKYGARPNTIAAKMKQMNPKIVNKRSKLLHDLIKKISLEKNKEWVGWKGKVLIDQNVKNFVVGRNFAYKSVVIKENIPLGKIVEAEIFRADKHSIFGQIVKSL
jgi:threonylcarbamoyladenosine tRNA methylthiotransferase CDKAL1